MKEFMHVGVPTTVAREGEIYAEGIKTCLLYTSDAADE